MFSSQRLLDNTPGNHPDYVLLKQAERVMHEFARKINTANETQIEDSQQETLKKLELLLITDVGFLCFHGNKGARYEPCHTETWLSIFTVNIWTIISEQTG